ncbi:MAG: alanyl-tRNA editing protein [Mogibacterium sp.]|nr:alanyl-tRNA editing protein [Mogibacterium sp.]
MERIYRTNQYARECETVVTEVQEKNGQMIISCEASVFYPEGGGQPSDTGTVTLGSSVFKVISAHDQSLEGQVWHYTDAPAGTFKPGDKVTLTIDWDKRFVNMQRHLGEHMLSGTFHSLCGGVNKGFHMGEDYITIDIDLGGRMLTEEELDAAQDMVNRAVWADLPVTVTWFDDYESSLVLPVRKQVPHEGRVSVVTVGDLSDPYDCIACCGTHPSTSGQVGLVALYKCEPNKGMNRVFFDCGRKAMERLAGDFRILSDVARRYSCSPADLESRLDAEAANISSLKGRISAFASYVTEREKASILAEISEDESPAYVYSSDLLSTDELLKLGFAVMNETSGKLLIFMQPESRTCLLFSSGEAKCGKLVKENAKAFGGRGGGRDDNARAVFTELKDMKAFAAAVSEMVQ